MHKAVKPFLKWPGGKRWIVPHIAQIVRARSFNRYFEPFLGGGAVFFGLHPERAVLSDINPDLILTYIQVRDRHKEVIDELKNLQVDASTYLRVRAETPSSDLDTAVRFLYLNRTAFAGMYRLNREGRFNVPYGGGQRTPEPLWRDNLLAGASTALTNVELRCLDFENVIEDARAGDLLYCDPTYTVAHNNNGFVRYNERNFSWEDQQRLARAATSAAERGAVVLVSNAAHDDIRDLYPKSTIHLLGRQTLLCPDPSKRGRTQEYLIELDFSATKGETIRGRSNLSS